MAYIGKENRENKEHYRSSILFIGIYVRARDIKNNSLCNVMYKISVAEMLFVACL